MKKLFQLIAVLLFIAVYTNAATLNVPSQYTTIQAAINASVNGDTVLVAPGTYMENINFRGKNIVVTSRYFITLDPATINATIINGSTPAHADTASCVIITSGEDSTTVLQGFTLTGGTGTLWEDEHSPGAKFREGGGVLIQASRPIIQNNIIRNNQAMSISGGAVSAGGGGIRIGDGNPTVVNNIIMSNQARYGPGVVLNYSGGTFRNNILCFNTGGYAYSGGGAFWILEVSPAGPRIIENNTMLKNTCQQGTGGILCNTTTATIRNNIIRDNTEPSILPIGGSTIQVTYNNISGGYPGAGNINAVPMFADTNYMLASGSPCIDKGDSSAIYNDIADPNNPSNAKYPSKGGLRNDMGAYGGPLAMVLSNQIIGIPNIGSQLPQEFALYQNYPNPFNPSTNITFDLPKGGFVTLKLYDILGKEVLTLANDFRQAGRHNIKLDGSSLSSGVYFYKLFYENGSITNKMILSK